MEGMTSAIHDIVSRLKALDPYRIVLFGSVASGTEELGNDIDVLVILDSEKISQTYEERMQGRLLVRESLLAVNKHVPIDLIVYTRGEYEFLQQQGSSFLQEIESSGKTLYEKVD
jgi:predicted nucleotidyltransferase